MTQKQIYEIFKSFAKQHAMINDCMIGSYFKIDTVQHREYPIMNVTPKPSNGVVQQEVRSYDILFADILDTSETNLQEIWSDQEQNAYDFLRFYSATYGDTYLDLYDLRLNDNYTITPIYHLLVNDVAGVLLSITFISPMNTSRCIIPQ